MYNSEPEENDTNATTLLIFIVTLSFLIGIISSYMVIGIWGCILFVSASAISCFRITKNENTKIDKHHVNFIMSEAEYLYTKDLLDSNLKAMQENLVERIVNKEVEEHNGNYLTKEHVKLIKEHVDKYNSLELQKILYGRDYEEDDEKNNELYQRHDHFMREYLKENN
jgi:hypothetical protein